jgi:hypothetical protein
MNMKILKQSHLQFVMHLPLSGSRVYSIVVGNR